MEIQDSEEMELNKGKNNSLLEGIDSKGFWRWCITLGISRFLDFLHRPVF
jgi:hypothetical protein